MTKEEYALLHRLFTDYHVMEIVEMLLKEPGLCVLEITDRVAVLQQSSISHHLRTLKDLGVIWFQKEGLFRYYAVDRERLQEILGPLFLL